MKFEDNSQKVKDILSKSILKTLESVGITLKSDAAMLAPVKDGNLRDSIDKVVKVNNEEATLYVGSNVEYAYYVEFGTGEFAEKGNGRKGGWFYKTPDGEVHFTYGQKPQSFIRKAFRSRKDDFIELLKKELGGVFNG